MKAALIKQMYDVFGPWSSFQWNDASPLQILELWPVKAVYWELTCILKADWYIVPPRVKGDYVRDVVSRPKYAETIEKYSSNITPLESIPLADYDLVITLDPVFKPPARTQTIFAYYVQEHWDRLYKESLQRPFEGYDLFLDHMMQAPASISWLPQALSFPYVHDFEFIRPQFSIERQDVVWADHRVLMTLAARMPGELAREEAAAAADRLEKVLNSKVRCRAIRHTSAWGVYDPPWWGDSVEYFRELAECRYYVGVGNMAGAGQGLAEAAALGCLCIGQTDRVYHRLLCHPSCLCEDIAEMPKRFEALRGNPGMWEEILAHQDANLNEHFLKRPLAAIERAVDMKRKAKITTNRMSSESTTSLMSAKAESAVSAWPRIGLVTPVRNSAKYIEQTLNSVLGQSYPNLDYFVVDGGSTDGTVEIIRKYEKQLSGWVSEPDRGMYDALNKGFARTSGEIMGWISATDSLHTGALFLVGGIFRDLPKVEWITGRPTRFNEDGATVGIDRLPHWTRARFLAGFNRYIQQESTFWRRSLWEKAGGRVDDSMRMGGDFELWVRFFRHAELYAVDALIGGFRVHEASLGLQQLEECHRIHNEIIERELRGANGFLGARVFRRVNAGVKKIPVARYAWWKLVERPLELWRGNDPPVIRYDGRRGWIVDSR